MCKGHCIKGGAKGFVEGLDSPVCTIGATDNSHLCSDGGAQKACQPGLSMTMVLASWSQLHVAISIMVL